MPAQYKVVSVQVSHVPLLRPGDFSSRDLPGQRPDDPLSDFILDLENLFQIAIVSLSPDVSACHGLDKLSCDTHPSPHLANAALSRDYVEHYTPHRPPQFPAECLDDPVALKVSIPTGLQLHGTL